MLPFRTALRAPMDYPWYSAKHVLNGTYEQRPQTHECDAGVNPAVGLVVGILLGVTGRLHRPTGVGSGLTRRLQPVLWLQDILSFTNKVPGGQNKRPLQSGPYALRNLLVFQLYHDTQVLTPNSSQLLKNNTYLIVT
jgi:hypothetical protein